MNILVWGTGQYAEHILDKYRLFDKISGFITNSNPSKHFFEKYGNELAIYKSSDLETLSFDFLLVAVLSKTFMQQIYDECVNQQVDINKVIFLPSLLTKNNDYLSDQEKYIFALLKEDISVPISYLEFIHHWRWYFYNNMHVIISKVDRLKEGLDDASKDEVDQLMDRNFKLLPLPEHEHLYFWHQGNALSEQEKQLLAISQDWEVETRRQHNIPAEFPTEISVFYYECGLYYLPKSRLASLKGRAFIDGGAFWGDSAIIMNRYSPSSIYCFEPFERNYNHLKDTIERRSLANIIPVQLGLGENTETLDFYHDNSEQALLMNAGHVHSEFSNVTNKTEISTISIDAFSSANNLEVGLIKLDVEGHELAVIKGALKTIKDHRPVLLISIYHTPEDLFEIKPLIESLNLGYTFLVRHLSYVCNAEVMLIAY